MRALFRIVTAGVAAVWLGAAPAAAEKVTVFAAASMKTALDAVAADWKAETGGEAVISYAASSALAKQIESGAPAEIFISADLAWMDYLQERGLLRPESRSNLVGNTLVLIGTAGEAAPVAIVPGFDLLGLLGGGRLALGAVESVPAGKYAKAALTSLGVWDAVADHLAQAENVRAALLLVSRGEAPYGIVYRTDAVADAGVTVVGVFPEGSHPAIVYPVALTAAGDGPAAVAFLGFLTSPAAAGHFKQQGFDVLE